MTAAIETDGLSKDFPTGFWRPQPYRALDNLTLSVDAGQVFGFLGPNGAGKSTTLKLLMQLIYPTAGSARILGRPAGDVAVRRRIGFLPENPYFYDYLTAEELLGYFARLFGYRGADVTARVSRLLDEVGLAAERRMRLRQYSKGMLQRVGLAQALINDPEVLFLDEPMSGLDPVGRRDVRDLILRQRSRGGTVFFSSHILSDAEAICGRVGIMANGKMVTSGRVSDILAFESKGWDLVVDRVAADLRVELEARVRGVTEVSPGRLALDLSAETRPEPLVAELASRGAVVVSLSPVRHTLEDYFLESVKASAPRDTSGL